MVRVHIHIVCAIASFTILAGTAHGSVVGSDAFAYSSGTSIAGGNGGTGWVYNSAAGAVPTSWIDTGGDNDATPPGVTTTAGGISRNFGNGGTASAVGPNGEIFFKIDLSFTPPDPNSGVTTPSFGLASLSSGSQAIRFGAIDVEGVPTYGIEADFPGGASYADTYLAVADAPAVTLLGSIQWDAMGGQGVVKLWVDPNEADFDTDLGQDNYNVTPDTSAAAILYYGSNIIPSNAVQLQSDGVVHWSNLMVTTSFNEAMNVPEPASICFASITGCLMAARRRRATKSVTDVVNDLCQASWEKQQ